MLGGNLLAGLLGTLTMPFGTADVHAFAFQKSAAAAALRLSGLLCGAFGHENFTSTCIDRDTALRAVLRTSSEELGGGAPGMGARCFQQRFGDSFVISRP
jgi:hypothetical protein